jgi:hypothetical protein
MSGTEVHPTLPAAQNAFSINFYYTEITEKEFVPSPFFPVLFLSQNTILIVL